MEAPLLAELQRRRVFRALVAYGIAAFAVLQIIEPVMHGLHWPDAVLSYVVLVLAAGFPVVVSVAWTFDINQGRVERAAPATGGRKGLRALALLGIGAIAAAPGTIWYFAVRGIASRPPAAERSSRQPVPSIAVLPFADMSPGKDQEYLADGIAEEILDDLAHIDGLRVIGRTSSFSFKGKADDLRAIAEKLGVAHILEGSVRREGDRIRVTAQLIEAAGASHVWSQTLEREAKSVFAVEDEIARAVVTALKVRLVPGAQAAAHVVQPDAYSEYLLGKQLSRLPAPENYRRSVAAFQRALALDGTFAPAWAGLAAATFRSADLESSLPAVSAGYERALAAAEKAVLLDPDAADAFATRGFLRTFVKWDWSGARSDLERALTLNAGDSENHNLYAYAVLAPLGHLAEAVTEAQQATSLDPLYASAWSTVGRLQLMTGEIASARAALERSLRILPEQTMAPRNLAVALLLENRPAEALTAAELAAHEAYRLQGRALALRASGRMEESRETIRKMTAQYADNFAYQIAEAYAWFNERDQAFAWLDRAYLQHDSGLHALKYDVLCRGLHADPRWNALLVKMRLPLD